MSNRYTLDQGSIIYGLKSIKYPECKCYGILITASCDIANSKVSKYYYLIGVEADEWFKSAYCFKMIFNKKIQQLFDKYSKIISDEGFDAKTLFSFTPEEINTVINSKDIKHQKKILETLKKLKSINNCTSILDLKNTEINVSKIILDKLKSINKGEEYHYYYLPQDSFLNNKILNKGIIVDLQEIGFIYPDEANLLIENKGIDASLLDELDLNENTLTSLKSTFYLENDDFIDIESTISSPWREHLMQRFSHGFIRIGLDGALTSDLEAISNRICGE